MATTVTIDSVTTADAVPTAVPHRISNKTGKSTATVTFTTNGSGKIRAWMIRVGGAGLTSGLRAGGGGVVCGVTRCGSERSLALALATPVTEDVTYAEAAPNADGTYSVNVYGATDDGWAM